MKGYMTVTETAHYIKRTRQAVLYAIKADILPAERFGNQLAIKKADVKRCYVPCEETGGMMLNLAIMPGYVLKRWAALGIEGENYDT